VKAAVINNKASFETAPQLFPSEKKQEDRKRWKVKCANIWEQAKKKSEKQLPRSFKRKYGLCQTHQEQEGCWEGPGETLALKTKQEKRSSKKFKLRLKAKAAAVPEGKEVPEGMPLEGKRAPPGDLRSLKAARVILSELVSSSCIGQPCWTHGQIWSIGEESTQL